MPEAQQTSDYPGALDTWVTVDNKEDLVEESDINKIKAAILAVQTEIGTDPAGTLATLKLRLAAALHTNGALAQGTSFPVSPTPVEGQVFYRTDENTPYVYDGANWQPFIASSYEFFTANGTFTVPGGISMVYVTMVGGGGGAARVTAAGAGGGGGGESIITRPHSVTPAAEITVVVGAAGVGRTTSAGDGTNGGNSSFDSSLIALGGGAGQATVGGTGGGVGLNGTSTATNVGGAAGGDGIKGGDGGSQTSTGDGGGGGGGSVFGAGGAGGNAGVVGANATGNGAGGGGGGDGVNGGNGSAGFVLVAW